MNVMPETATVPTTLASDVLPPRNVSSRGMLKMFDRLESDSAGGYIIKTLRSDELHPVDISRVSDITKPEGTESVEFTADWSWLPSSARTSVTGLALLYIKIHNVYHPRLAIAPAFPIRASQISRDYNCLLSAVNPSARVGIILLRLGHVAIGIANDETLIKTKIGHRWVPGQHRAGGSSVNRFKRNRENWTRQFFDKAARLAETRFAEHPHRLDWLFLGGDQHTLNLFLERTNLPDGLERRISGRRLDVRRPRGDALKHAVRQVWSSTIYELAVSNDTDIEPEVTSSP